MMAILKLIPACKSYIWGGTRLKKDFNKKSKEEKIAETWELSCHPDGESVISNGIFQGKTLSQYIQNEGKETLGKNCIKFKDFPILIKLIDAEKDLSIQVHPDNTYALEHENQYGKTEMWYVVDCKKGSSLYYGFEKELNKEEFKERIKNNTLLEVLHKVPVKKGDVFFIESGTIHAIGKGILLAEIQQSSNVTYRVYDYGRLGTNGKPRSLHIEKALDVTHLGRVSENYDFGNHLASCDYFTVDKLDIDTKYDNVVTQDSFHSLLILNGKGTIKNKNEKTTFEKGESIFLPADSGSYSIEGNCRIILTTVDAITKKYRVGIDLGGTNIKAGIVDEKNHIISKLSIPTLVQRPWKEIVKDMANMVISLLKNNNLTMNQISSLGIGSPGLIDAKSGTVIYSNNFYWDNVPIKKELENYFTLPIFISNDANCAALGEVVAGAAKGCKSVVLLTLGTGVGGGVVLDGKVFEGGSAGGAELGHTVIVSGGEDCTCGRKGCLEVYASATALIRNAKRAAEACTNSVMNQMCKENLEKMNGLIPFEAAKLEDVAAKSVVEQYIHYLSEGIVNMINIFRPEKVLLSGGVCNQGVFLTDPINAYVKQNCFAGERVFISPVICATLGNDAGIIGAANLSE